jgi:hypothetical protein
MQSRPGRAPSDSDTVGGVRGRLAAIFILGCCALCGGATAAAQRSGSDVPRIRMTAGCLDVAHVTVRIAAKPGTMLSPVDIRAPGYEAVHLTGVTGEASVRVHVPRNSRVTVTGETTGGTRFSTGRTYRRCPSRPLTSPPVVSGGGAG